jgi:hypothetical protein
MVRHVTRLWVLFAIGCGAAPPTGPQNKPSPHAAAFEVTWMVHPFVPDPKDPEGLPLRPLTLVAGTERIELERQLGALEPYNQSVCAGEGRIEQYPLREDEVAKITFYEGGAGGYLVKRTPQGLALIAWGLSDGACEDPETGEVVECKRSEREVRVFAVGPKVHVKESLLVVDATGKQLPIDCVSTEAQ